MSIVPTPEPEQDPTESLAAAEARLKAEAAAFAPDAVATGTDLVAGSVPAEVTRRTAGEQVATIAAKRREMEAVKEQMRADLERRLSEMNEAMAPLIAQAKRLDAAITNVTLYLGASEEIVTLATGEPAPDGTPIGVRQMVLSMDEETAAEAAARLMGCTPERSQQ